MLYVFLLVDWLVVFVIIIYLKINENFKEEKKHKI